MKSQNPPSFRFIIILSTVVIISSFLIILILSTQQSSKPANRPISETNTTQTYPTPAIYIPPTKTPWYEIVQKNGTQTITIFEPIAFSFTISDNHKIYYLSNADFQYNSRSIDGRNRGIVWLNSAGFPCDTCTNPTINWTEALENDPRDDLLIKTILSNHSVTECNYIYPEEFVQTKLYGKNVYYGKAIKDPCPNGQILEMHSFADVIRLPNGKRYVLTIDLHQGSELSKEILYSLSYTKSP